MSAYVEKLLPILIYPLGLALAVAIILVWLASTPVFANLLTVTLEEQNPSVPIETISPVDVAIVLSGGIAERRSTGDAAIGDVPGPGDRLMQAVSLWRAGKVKRIIVSGAIEAGPAAEILEAYGVPRDLIIVDSKSRNTHENAINTAVIWRERGFRSGLLVTSATHMPRALASFRKAGLDVLPWPADFRGGYPQVGTVFAFLPNARALDVTKTAIKEWLGLAVYRLRGWA
jgi:uncharacterized SAM-binding protein YcdF (DUF218 family)